MILWSAMINKFMENMAENVEESWVCCSFCVLCVRTIDLAPLLGS